MGITPCAPVNVFTSRTGAVTRTIGFDTATVTVAPTATVTVASAGVNVGVPQAYEASSRPPGGRVSDAVQVDPAGMLPWVRLPLAGTARR